MENQQITTSTQSHHLSQISQSALVRNLLENRFDLIPSPVSIQEAVQKGTPMAVLRHVAHEENLVLAIEFEILSATGRLNLNPNLTLKPGQAPQIAKIIFDTFKTETLGDLKLAFARGAAGLYGEIYRLDGAVLVKWIQAYLEEKYAVVEQIHQKRKEQEKEDDNFDPKEFYKRVAEWGEKKKEIEEEAKRIKYEDRIKDAEYRMSQLSAPQRPTFICDGIEVIAANERYAKMAYKEMFKREPDSVTLKVVGGESELTPGVKEK